MMCVRCKRLVNKMRKKGGLYAPSQDKIQPTGDSLLSHMLFVVAVPKEIGDISVRYDR